MTSLLFSSAIRNTTMPLPFCPKPSVRNGKIILKVNSMFFLMHVINLYMTEKCDIHINQ